MHLKIVNWYPTIQKDIINCCAKETMKRIVDDLGDDYYAILANESSDVSQKEYKVVITEITSDTLLDSSAIIL